MGLRARLSLEINLTLVFLLAQVTSSIKCDGECDQAEKKFRFRITSNILICALQPQSQKIDHSHSYNMTHPLQR